MYFYSQIFKFTEPINRDTNITASSESTHKCLISLVITYAAHHLISSSLIIHSMVMDILYFDKYQALPFLKPTYG